jgi:hypothetical protein
MRPGGMVLYYLIITTVVYIKSCNENTRLIDCICRICYTVIIEYKYNRKGDS